MMAVMPAAFALFYEFSHANRYGQDVWEIEDRWTAHVQLLVGIIVVPGAFHHPEAVMDRYHRDSRYSVSNPTGFLCDNLAPGMHRKILRHK